MDDIGDNYMVQSMLYMGVANVAKSGVSVIVSKSERWGAEIE